MSKPGSLNELADMLVFLTAFQGLKSLAEDNPDKEIKKYIANGLKVAKTVGASRSFGSTIEGNWEALTKAGAKETGLKRLLSKSQQGGLPTKSVAGGMLISIQGAFATKLISNNRNFPLALITALWSKKPANIKQAKRAAIKIQGGDAAEGLGLLGSLQAGQGKATKRLVLWAKGVAQFGDAPSDLDSAIDDQEKAINAGKKLGQAKKNAASFGSENPDGRLQAELEQAQAEAEANEVIATSKNPDQAKNAVVNSAAQQVAQYQHLTRVGGNFGLNNEQEQMLITKSKKVLMAASAGSGKTHTLTALIQHKVEEERVRPTQIMVSSFTNAASNEIKSRVSEKSTVKIRGKAESGFGTIHSLCARNVHRYAKAGTLTREERPLQSKGKPKYISKGGKGRPNETYYQDQLMLLAVRQVSFLSGVKAPQPRNLITNAPIDVEAGIAKRQKQLQQEMADRMQAQSEVKYVITAEVMEALKGAWKYYNFMGNTEYDYYRRSDGRHMQKSISRRHVAPYNLIQSYMNGSESGYGRNTRQNFNPTFSVGDEVNSQVRDDINRLLEGTGGQGRTNVRLGSTDLGDFDEGGAGETGETKTEKINYFKKEDCKWWNEPAGMWFNIGHDFAATSGDDDEEDKAKMLREAVGDAGRIIARLKGKAISPLEAWYKVGQAAGVNQISEFDVFSAVYGAYEWLKGRTDEVPRDGDMTDIVVDACRILARDHSLRADLQRRFKVLLVDEAQDLNRLQHMFFGLIAGTMDPKTLEEIPAKNVRKDLNMYAMIGDDKQAIYAFQGADSQEMIGRSDMQGGDYETKLLTINYRSGKSIIDCANEFIEHNEDRIPMTCNAALNPNGDLSEGEGSVSIVEMPMVEGSSNAQSEGAKFVIGDILSLHGGSKDEEGEGNFQWKDFGIAVRTNAEGELYATSCLEMGIPFKGAYNPLKKKELSGVLSWMKLARWFQTRTGDQLAILKGLKRYPNTYLGNYVFDGYFSNIPNPLDDVINKGYQKNWVSTRGSKGSYRYNKGRGKVTKAGESMDALRDNILRVQKFVKSYGSAPIPSKDLYEFIMKLVHGGKTIIDTIMDEIKESPDQIGKIQEGGGEVTEGMIKEAAYEKIKAMISLVKLGAGKEEIPTDEEGDETELVSSPGYLSDLYDFVDRAENQKAEKDQSKVDAVAIRTVHKWKGLEAHQFYVPCGANWPRMDLATTAKKKDINPNNLDEKVAREYMESERRLMYVAITRAEQSLTLVHTPHMITTKAGVVKKANHFIGAGEVCAPKEDPSSRGKLGSLIDQWGETMYDPTDLH